MFSEYKLYGLGNNIPKTHVNLPDLILAYSEYKSIKQAMTSYSPLKSTVPAFHKKLKLSIGTRQSLIVKLSQSWTRAVRSYISKDVVASCNLNEIYPMEFSSNKACIP